MSSQKERLDNLSERIRKAEAVRAPEPKTESGSMRNAGYDFAGVLLGSVVIGVLLDRFFDSAPWVLLGMLGLGFVSGVFGLWKILRKPQDKE